MNYTKQINELKTARINGDNINIELMNIDNKIYELRKERAARTLKIFTIMFILGVTVLSFI